MKSIRLSLMVYFLALLAVALLAASLLVYRNAEEYRDAEKKAMEQLIQTQYQDRCRDAQERLNNDLLSQAQLLARLVQVQLEWYRAELFQGLMVYGLATSNFNPSGHLLMPLWLAEAMPIPFQLGPPPPASRLIHSEVRRGINSYLFNIKIENEMLLPRDTLAGEYYQINCERSKPYCSPTMGDRSFTLPAADFDQDAVVHIWFDDTKLGQTPVHRVVLQASGVAQERLRPGPVPRDRRERQDASARRPSAPPLPGPPPIRRGPTIWVHCATKTDKLGVKFAGFSQQRDDELVKVSDDSRDSLRDLRHWLWGISLAVFAATAVGTFWLVYLGLSPLRRLSYAVSRVSVKDFRLPLDEEPLPLELRPIADRLATTLDLLKRAFAREKQAAADISHELRTPLAALMTTTELALRKPRSAEHYRELLGDVHASAQQMNQIVERLLTLARLDAGVDRLRVQSVDAAALAQQCADVVRPLAEARGLKLTVKKPPPALVQIDPDKLREIVSNLLHNAIQYNRPGGAIDLRVQRQNGKLEVEVQDTGIGIAAEVRERIFERFYRADPSRGGDDLHAGLGLAIVKEYIDLMGGSIGVESIEGQGSTFRVLLPVR
jgi:two-component system, OmpR family, heavy metal sensor histidine kinase CusS